MNKGAYNFCQIMSLLVVAGTAGLVTGCGKTLVFAERDGVNLAIRSNASSTPPLEVNFGLNRTIATIVPPTGESNGKPDGDAVSMFAGFQVDNTIVPTKPLDADLKISTQFASGKAATTVATQPKVVAQIVNARTLTFATSESAKQLELWLWPDEKFSKPRSDKLQDWLTKQYPTKGYLVIDLSGDSKDGELEAVRKAALSDKALMATPR